MRFLLVSLTESEKITVNGKVGGEGEDWVWVGLCVSEAD